MLTDIQEYIYGSFDIHADGFCEFFAGDKEREAFYSDVETVFGSIGWHEENGYMVKVKSSLYIHPHQFLGHCLPEEVEEIGKALALAKTFKYWGFRHIEKRYDVTPEQEISYMQTRREEIESRLQELCKTRKRTTFSFFDFWNLKANAKRFALSPIDEKILGTAAKYVSDVLQGMAKEGKLITAEINGKVCYRTKFKTEK